jgi:hypothetical protein
MGHQNIDWSGTIVAIAISKRKAVDLMKIEISFLASLFLIGTTLLARVAVRGIEQALLATAVEYGLKGINATRKLLAPNID